MTKYGIGEPDIPGVAENSTPYLNPYMEYLESYGYMPSKPYAQPLVIGQTTRVFPHWNGYSNISVRPYDISNPFAYIAPKIPMSPNVMNAKSLRPGMNTGFAGQAPVRGIFTGVNDDNTTCH